MNKVTMGILAFVALAAFCLVPLGVMDTDAEITAEDGTIMKVSGKATFDIEYTLSGTEEGKLTYEAKVVDGDGKTQSNAVTPSSGSLESGVSKSLTVTGSRDSGSYRLVVEYFVGEDDDKKSVHKDTMRFKVVDPIVLKLNLKADNTDVSLDKFEVYFVVDGKKMEDSYTFVSFSSDGTGSASYEWIADPSDGEHTFYVEAVSGSDMIKGLNEKHTFYVGETSYTWLTVVIVIILIILIILAIRIYRKPIKNYGKPKSRR